MVWLGVVQLASVAAYGDLGVVPSVPAFVHGVAPGLFRGAIGGVRARAAAALHDGDLATAGALISMLPDDAGAADLRGRLAAARGDRGAALDAYVRAGDLVRAQGLIDAVAVSDPGRALEVERRLVARLGDDPRASEVTGQAWWRLGQLQAAVGYRDAAHRGADWRDAEGSYERALALAPNEETYLLAAGFQSLANGDVSASRRWYRRAAEVVPNSADAYAGMAWSAAAAGDCGAARVALARARELGARLPRPFPDPARNEVVGGPLRRCGA
jgi:tetratricopeptide (TPR) repeat protein